MSVILKVRRDVAARSLVRLLLLPHTNTLFSISIDGIRLHFESDLLTIRTPYIAGTRHFIPLPLFELRRSEYCTTTGIGLQPQRAEVITRKLNLLLSGYVWIRGAY